MDKVLFNKKIEPIGRMRRKWRGTDSPEDLIFEADSTPTPCDDCDLSVVNRIIIIERKMDSDDTPYWRTKCHNCKKKWKELRL
jgi:hypothetical protein